MPHIDLPPDPPDAERAVIDPHGPAAVLPDEVWRGMALRAANDNAPRLPRATTCCAAPAVRRRDLRPTRETVSVSLDLPPSPAREAIRRQDISKALVAANDNAPSGMRRPWLEEYQAGRFGDSPLDAFRLRTAYWWQDVHGGADNDPRWLASGTAQLGSGGGGSGPLMGDPAALRGAEHRAHVSILMRRMHERTGGASLTVHRAVVFDAEMRDLAPAGTPARHRAKRGREELLAGLDIVDIERLAINWFANLAA